MSRISDMIIDIQENLDENLTDKQIAEKVGCPVSWVEDERQRQFIEDHVAPFECENW
jgi:hypothetical protein